MTTEVLAALLLRTAALLLHAMLIGASPLLLGLADAGAALASGARPASPLRPFRAIASHRGAANVTTPDAVAARAAASAGFAAALVAALLVPSFVTGTLLAPLHDLVVLAFLLVLGRVAAIIGLAADGASVSVPALLRALPFVTLALPAILAAALALALLAGSTRIDTIAVAGSAAATVPRALALLALALAALADRDAAPASRAAQAPMRAWQEVTEAIRVFVWLDLLALLLPPASTCDALSGPWRWLVALALWSCKIGVLALLLGVARAVLGQARSTRIASLLGGATLAGLLGALFALFGRGLA